MSTVQRNINVLTQPKSQFTEAFRSLQTSLLLATAGTALRSSSCLPAPPRRKARPHGQQPRLHPGAGRGARVC
jgi:hypothetical protein